MTTIIVDQERCTKCGICATVCISGIIDAVNETEFPQVQETDAPRCMHCGHCEVFCPSEALLLDLYPDEKISIFAEAGNISSEAIALYFKKRRSVRHYIGDPVPKETILEILDVARYAASAGNSQTVQWLVVHEPEKVRKIAEITVEWMKGLLNTGHPMSAYIPMLLSAWEEGRDVICRGAPHLLFAHIPEGNLISPVDAIIALTHVDLAAPAFGIGTCWAGFVAAASMSFEPLKQELGLPAGRISAYAMMFGYPQYKICGIPRRKPLEVIWK